MKDIISPIFEIPLKDIKYKSTQYKIIEFLLMISKNSSMIEINSGYVPKLYINAEHNNYDYTIIIQNN